jgi:hypothetical protein
MTYPLKELEWSIVQFVRERVPAREWDDLFSRRSIESRMSDDDLSEMKDYVFGLMMDSVRWSGVIADIEDMARNQIPEVDSELEVSSDSDDRSAFSVR